MGWFFSVALPDDPAPCHDAAETLRSVARAARQAADHLDAQATLPREDFGGLAARSYRDASATLGNDTRGVADDTHALAAALDDYAARIAAVRRTLTGIRDDALAQGFTITAQDRIESVPVAGTTVDLPFQRLEARATTAHAEAESARRDWWQAVQDLTTGPLAEPTAAPFPYPPIGPPVGPPPGREEIPSDIGDRETDPRDTAPPDRQRDGQRDGQPPSDTSAPVAPTDPASSYETKAAPEPRAPHQPITTDGGPAGPTWHWAAIPLPSAPPALHGEPLYEEPSSSCPPTFKGVLT